MRAPAAESIAWLRNSDGVEAAPDFGAAGFTAARIASIEIIIIRRKKNGVHTGSLKFDTLRPSRLTLTAPGYEESIFADVTRTYADCA
jgi:hypothetical protein